MANRFYIDANNPKSKTGVELSPVPKTKLYPSGRNQKKIDREWRAWLKENAKKVAVHKFHLTIIDAVNVDNFSTSDGEMLNEFLFGDPYARIKYKP